MAKVNFSLQEMNLEGQDLAKLVLVNKPNWRERGDFNLEHGRVRMTNDPSLLYSGIALYHPSILDVACIGVPHPEMGEELKALAILRDDAAGDANEIIHFCRDRLSHYKCPKTVEFVTDLGRNTMGKINKRKLREPYWEGHS